MDANQAGRITRALEVLNEKRHAYDPESLAAQVGRLEYWLRDMIALAGELDGQPTPPAPRMIRSDDSIGRPEDIGTLPPAPRGWSTPPALDGYGYVLPEDYLRGGAQ